MRSTTPHRRARFSQHGFTLIEMMVVVVIMGTLAALAAPSVSRYMHRAKGQSAAQSVANTLRMAQNQAVSRGEVILAEVSVGDTTDGGGSIELFRTDNTLPNSGCDAADEDDFDVSDDPDCFARTCAQVAGMTEVSVHELDFELRYPDMTIAGMDPEADDGDSQTFCFSPSGRILEHHGGTLKPKAQSETGCDGTSARIFVRDRDGANDPGDNPIHSTSLDICVPSADESDRRDQKEGRDAANFYAIYVSYNGSISVRQ